MKQFIPFIILLLTLMSTPLSALSENSGAGPFIELVPTITTGKNSQAGLQLLGGATWNVSDEVGLGFGTGVTSSFKFDATPTIPLYFRSKFDLGSGNIIPYISFDAGYNFNLDDIDYSSILLAPTVGFRTHGFYLGAGYLASIATKGSSNVGHNITFRLGYQFGSKSGKKMRTPTFIKRSQVKLELGFAYDFDSKEHYIDYQYASHMGNAALSKLVWMFRMGDHFQLGIGSGLEVGLYKCEERYDDDTYTTTNGCLVIPAFIRPQYNIHFGDSKVVPFVLCDLGYKFDVSDMDDDVVYDGIMVEPQIGVSYKRFSLGVGGNLTKYKINEYGEEPQTTFVPKITLGVTFN